MCVSMWCGTHAGLVGKQPPLSPLADGDLQRGAKTAADDSLRLEGIPEDHAERGGDFLNSRNENHQSAQQEDGCHDRYQLFRYCGQPLHATQENHSADNDQYNPNDPGGNAECGLKGGANGVGLDHAPHKAQGQDNSHGKKARQELSKAAPEGGRDVVYRAAVIRAVIPFPAGLDGQSGLRVDGGHTEESNDPHPKDSSRATCENGAGGADNITRTHLCGNGGSQGLEGAHAVFMPVSSQL